MDVQTIVTHSIERPFCSLDDVISTQKVMQGTMVFMGEKAVALPKEVV